MDPLAIDLSHFKKKIRGKIRLAIYMGKLIHLLYLAVKNFRNEPEELVKYDSFQELLRDRDFVIKILMRESRSGTLKDEPLVYSDIASIISERGYTSLLELADLIWDLTIHHRKINPKALFNTILGIPSSAKSYVDIFLSDMQFYGKANYSSTPFAMDIKLYNFLAIEAEMAERTEDLAKTLIYIGSLSNSEKTLGLFARFSIKNIDAERIIHYQESGHAHRMLKMFRLYPTVLRMLRFAHKRIKAVKELEKEIYSMLSELYVDSSNDLGAIISMDVPANVLAMAPAISLGGGLCIATVFRGELLDPLGSRAEARIKISDTIINAYPSFNSLLHYSRYHQKEYVFLMFHPFTIPKIGIIMATFPVDILDNIRPRRRNINSLDYLFPRIHEIAKVY